MQFLATCRLPLVRRLYVAAALAGFVVATTGVPVVMRAPTVKDRSQPYPCMDHACGCASAEACWRNCCCFTNVQKLAWAEEHHVEPPQYVLAAAKREPPAPIAKTCCGSGHGACCAVAADCHESEAIAAHDCHAPHEAVDDSREPADGEVVTRCTVELVSAVQSRRCRGQAELWLSIGAVAPPPARTEFEIEPMECDSIVVSPPRLAGILQEPAAPPPRAYQAARIS
jgi:hypothetical protein